MKITLYCTKCGYEKILTLWLDAVAVTDTSYRLSRKGKEIKCPKCDSPLLSDPCILYPRGWKVLKDIFFK